MREPAVSDELTSCDADQNSFSSSRETDPSFLPHFSFCQDYMSFFPLTFSGNRSHTAVLPEKVFSFFQHSPTILILLSPYPYFNLPIINTVPYSSGNGEYESIDR